MNDLEALEQLQLLDIAQLTAYLRSGSCCRHAGWAIRYRQRYLWATRPSPKWIILAEVIIGVASYIKTKNLLLLFGVIIVVVFTTVGFQLAA
ncbi:type IV conjugative transfer system pilin TraA (plasmid) [Aeromonas salmonicida subsp. salmonicida]|uniref:type IV conjugative transfer system pilin TraA n=1 Tax=Aeromonas salmonicida TaxID=645 RepID=UPI00230015B1|nr:type IV conjugative transfer system pilin TraA [Aeromonas salmonicida]WCB52521.1 type IV conjugative transfer system pilin TraA [Aeromonas salmonicida subsp. salmonicida]